MVGGRVAASQSASRLGQAGQQVTAVHRTAQHSTARSSTPCLPCPARPPTRPTHLLHAGAVDLSQQRQDQRLLARPWGAVEQRVRAVAIHHLRRAEWSGVGGRAKGQAAVTCGGRCHRWHGSGQVVAAPLARGTDTHQLPQVSRHVIVQLELLQRLWAILQSHGGRRRGGSGEAAGASPAARPPRHSVAPRTAVTPPCLHTASLLVRPRPSLQEALATFDQFAVRRRSGPSRAMQAPAAVVRRLR